MIIAFNILKYRKPSLDLIYENLKNYKNDNINLKQKNLSTSKSNDKIIIKNISYKYPEKKNLHYKILILKLREKNLPLL